MTKEDFFEPETIFYKKKTFESAEAFLYRIKGQYLGDSSVIDIYWNDADHKTIGVFKRKMNWEKYARVLEAEFTYAVDYMGECIPCDERCPLLWKCDQEPDKSCRELWLEKWGLSDE